MQQSPPQFPLQLLQCPNVTQFQPRWTVEFCPGAGMGTPERRAPGTLGTPPQLQPHDCIVLDMSNQFYISTYHIISNLHKAYYRSLRSSAASNSNEAHENANANAMQSREYHATPRTHPRKTTILENFNSRARKQVSSPKDSKPNSEQVVREGGGRFKNWTIRLSAPHFHSPSLSLFFKSSFWL